MLQGEDFIISAVVRDSTTALVDLTAAQVTQIKAHVFIGFKQVGIYALNQEQGFLPMTLDGQHTVLLPVTRLQSANFPTGTIKVVVAVTRENIDFPNGKVTKYVVTNLGEVLQDNSIPVI
jgi:hypothetical protein